MHGQQNVKKKLFLYVSKDCWYYHSKGNEIIQPKQVRFMNNILA